MISIKELEVFRDYLGIKYIAYIDNFITFYTKTELPSYMSIPAANFPANKISMIGKNSYYTIEELIVLLDNPIAWTSEETKLLNKLYELGYRYVTKDEDDGQHTPKSCVWNIRPEFSQNHWLILPLEISNCNFIKLPNRFFPSLQKGELYELRENN